MPAYLPVCWHNISPIVLEVACQWTHHGHQCNARKMLHQPTMDIYTDTSTNLLAERPKQVKNWGMTMGVMQEGWGGTDTCNALTFLKQWTSP